MALNVDLVEYYARLMTHFLRKRNRTLLCLISSNKLEFIEFHEKESLEANALISTETVSGK